MGNANFTSQRSGEIIPGTLEMLVLKALKNGPMNGADIAAAIHDVSEGALTAKEGALYPALHRLQRHGFVECEAGVSRNQRQAKFYRLTASGVSELERQWARWATLANAVGKVMQKP